MLHKLILLTRKKNLKNHFIVNKFIFENIKFSDILCHPVWQRPSIRREILVLHPEKLNVPYVFYRQEFKRGQVFAIQVIPAFRRYMLK